jgi:hypothetical protein
VLPFGRLWYDAPDNAIGYAMHSSRSHHAVIRVYDATGNVIETHEHAEDPSATSSGVFQRTIPFNDADRKFLTLLLIIGPPLL